MATTAPRRRDSTLAALVWESALSPELKPLAALLAVFADRSGIVSLHVETLAELRGQSARNVQHGLTELRRLGVIVPEKHVGGGRGRPVTYRIVAAALPSRGTSS